MATDPRAADRSRLRAELRRSREARIAYIEKRYESARDARRPLEDLWSVVEEFVFSQHGGTNTWWKARNSRRSVPVVPALYNHLKPTVMSLHAEAMADRRRFSVLPVGNEPGRILRALAARGVLDALKDRDDTSIKTVRSDALLSALLWANTPVWLGWNPKGGRWLTGPDGSQVLSGAPWWHASSPWELLPAKHGASLDRKPYIFRERTLDRDTFEAWHGLREEADPEEAVSDPSDVYQSGRAAEQYGMPDLSYDEESVVYREYRERPGGPLDGVVAPQGNGYYAILADGRMVHEGGLPDIDAGIVYGVHVAQWFRNPRWFWSAGVLEDAVPLNDLVDRMLTQIFRYFSLMVHGKVIVDSTVDTFGKFTSDSFEIIKRPPGAKIDFWRPEPPNANHAMLPQMFIEFINELSGVREPSRGKVPQGADTATAVAILRRSDATRVGAVTNAVSDALALVARDTLRLVSRRVHMDEALDMIGPSYRARTEEFAGQAVDPDGLDVREVPDETLPENPAARIALLVQMRQADIISASTAQLLARIESSETEPFDPQALHREEAHAQAMRMLSFGEPAEAKWYEDHEVHRTWKALVLISDIGRRAPPEFRALLEENIKQHDLGLQAEMGRGLASPRDPALQSAAEMARGGQNGATASPPRPRSAVADLQASGGVVPLIEAGSR